MSASSGPPRHAERFVGALIADAEQRDAVLGDLAEEHSRISATRGHKWADGWYRRQVVRSTLPLAYMSVAHHGWKGWGRLLLAVAAGYVTVSLGAAAVRWVPPALRSIVGSEHIGIAGNAALAAINMLVMVAAGYVAAVIARHSSIAAALALAALMSAVAAATISYAETGHGHPPWLLVISWALFVLMCVIGVVSGAMRRTRHLARRTTRTSPGI